MLHTEQFANLVDNHDYVADEIATDINDTGKHVFLLKVKTCHSGILRAASLLLSHEVHRRYRLRPDVGFLHRGDGMFLGQVMADLAGKLPQCLSQG